MPKQPEADTFFLDRSLGNKVVATALRQAGVRIEIHDDHFHPAARDQDWLREVGAKAWVILTNDRQIRYRAIERTALLSSGARVFAFTRGNWSGQEMADVFLKALPRIRNFLRKHKGPFIATITRGADVRMIVSGAPVR